MQRDSSLEAFRARRARIAAVLRAAGGGIGTTVSRMVAEAGATVIAVSRCLQNLD